MKPKSSIIQERKKGILLKIPKKKPKGKELLQADKKRNKAISKKRIYVEHAIGGIKRLGIASNIFRNIKKILMIKQWLLPLEFGICI